MGHYNKIVVASGYSFPDALAAGSYIKNENALLFLSDGNSLPQTSLELVAVGGENALKLNGFNGKRIAGDNRYETALALAQESHPNSNNIVLASGESFPDALAAISLASELNAPIVLGSKTSLNVSIQNFIVNKDIYIVGGENTISSNAIESGTSDKQDDESRENNKSKDKWENLIVNDESDFIFDSESHTITEYVGERFDPVIPQTIAGVEVKNIGERSFFGKGIVSVYIPDGVENIEKGAFQGYKYANHQIGTIENTIRDFRLPETLKYIGEHAFADNKNISKIDIPSSVETIDSGAFSGNQISSLIIPDNVKEIGEGAFKENKIVSLKLSKGLSTISLDAFADNFLTELDLPGNIIGIGGRAFKKNSLKKINFAEGLRQIDFDAFAENSLVSLDLPQSLTNIGDGAFRENNISKLVLPETISQIGKSSFEENSLRDLSLPDNLVEIPSGAFKENQIVNIDLPLYLNKIGYGAFSNNNIEKLTIPNHVKTIEDYAFYMNELREVSLGESLERIRKRAFEKNNISGSLIIPDSMRVIDQWAFSKNKIENIVIGNGLETIGVGAFDTNNISTRLSIPKNIRNIYHSAFDNNPIPDSEIAPEFFKSK